MCNLRLKWLQEELISAGKQPVYIFMHHPPFDIGLPYVDKIKLFEFEDFGEILIHGDKGRGYIRLDWYTPDALPNWGDGRLTILGTKGYIELRKYVDLVGREGKDHLF